MIKFFEYCFYRIRNSKLSQLSGNHPQATASALISYCETMNILTIIFAFHLFYKNQHYLILCVIAIIIFLYVINTCLLLTEKKYKRLIEYYKDEKHKKLKGWGVFLYVVGSIFLAIYTGLYI